MAMCALPALGFRMPGASGRLASFYFACPAPDVAPSVRTTLVAGVRSRPRVKDAGIAIYVRGQAPPRKYRVLGTVGVLSHSGQTHEEVLRDWAKRTARRMGGDALVDLWCDDAAAARVGDQGMLYLTASVVSWQ